MRTFRPRLRALAVTAALLVPTALLQPTLSASAAQGSVGKGKPTPGTVELQLLNISDFHGNLEPLNVNRVDVGGAAVLKAYFDQERANNPNTILFTGGDAVGASPPISSFFQDAPTIEWMNTAGFDAYAIGNHDFDAGLGRLQEQIAAADFPYLGANLRNLEGNLTGIAPYTVLDVAGVKVAMIGVTNPEAPTLVAPGNTGTIDITEPARAAQQARAAALKDGASVFVAFGHLGVTSVDAAGQGTGPLIDFARAVTGFDAVVGDHTNVEYQEVINGALVSENKSFGVGYSRTTLTVQKGQGRGQGGGSGKGVGNGKDRVVAKDVRFVTPLVSGVTPDPAVQARVAELRAEVQKSFDVPIGTASGVLPRGGTPAVERVGEVAVGNVVTDALRTTYGTQIAFTNGGGLRSALPSSYAPADTSLRRPAPGYAAGPPFDLVLGDAYTLLPFGNAALTRTVTGAQLWSTLEFSVARIPAADGRFLQISGFRFTYDAAQPAGSRVVSVTLNDGTPVANDASLTLTAATNDFTNSGGDGYTNLADGQGVTRDLLANVTADYLRQVGTVSPATEGRITRLN
jgi:5'-nucleotidase